MKFMKKAWIFILPLALCAASMVYALEATRTGPAAVSYDRLGQLVIDGGAAYRKELQQIRKTEIAIGEMQSKLDELYENWEVNAPAIISLQSSLYASEDALEALREELDSKAVRQVYAAQKMYAAHYTLTPETEIARRELEASERELAICRQKLSRGMVTPDAVRTAERNADNQKDAVKAAQKKVDDNLEALAEYLNLDNIEPQGLPVIDLARIADRDLTADRAAYRLSASAAEEKVMNAAQDAYDKSGSSADWYAYTIALEDYEAAKNRAEKAFPKVYEALRDAYDDFIGSTAVSEAQKKYDAAESQFARGLIAQNALFSVERTLLNAKDRQEQQRIGLWMQMMEYEYNLLR